MSRLAAFSEHLTSIGTPYISVRALDDPPAADNVEIQYHETATPAEIDAAEAAKLAFDWRERQPRPRSDVMDDLAALTVAERNHIDRAMMADFLCRNPDYALKMGIDVIGDEPIDP